MRQYSASGHLHIPVTWPGGFLFLPLRFLPESALRGRGGVSSKRLTILSSKGDDLSRAGFGLCSAIMYRLYIDETGNADLKASDDPNHRYLSLSGLIMTLTHAREHARPQFDQLKQDIFSPDPDEPLILHRKPIVNKNYPFDALRDPAIERKFNNDLLHILRTLRYTVITVVIDKLEHLKRYTVWRYDPYHYCLEVLLERYILSLSRRNLCGDVVAEVRSKNPDKRLKNCYAYLYENGTRYVKPDVVQRCLTSKHLKLKQKILNITGLQMADLIAHPSAMYVRSQNTDDPMPDNFGSKIVQVLIDQKYDRDWSGRIPGWGTKWLPKG